MQHIWNASGESKNKLPLRKKTKKMNTNLIGLKLTCWNQVSNLSFPMA